MEPSAEGARWAVEDWISASSSALVLGTKDDGGDVADVGAADAEAAEAGTDAVLESPVDAADEAVYVLRASAAMERGDTTDVSLAASTGAAAEFAARKAEEAAAAAGGGPAAAAVEEPCGADADAPAFVAPPAPVPAPAPAPPAAVALSTMTMGSNPSDEPAMRVTLETILWVFNQ